MANLPQKNETCTLTVGKAYFNERELAERLGMSLKWVQKKRGEGGGVDYVKIGSSVRYYAADILDFEQRCRRQNTSQTERW